MTRWLGPLLVLVVSAVLAHVQTLDRAPSFIMTRAMDALAARGVALHDFTAPQRIAPQSQQVVRSSPDLYYALCRFDLTRPENEPGLPRLTVTMAQWDAYQSLSFFDARTNNFATIRGTGKAVKISLETAVDAETSVVPYQGRYTGTDAPDLTVHTPTETGVILIRRLAPTAASFARAAKVGEGDACLYGREPAVVF